VAFLLNLGLSLSYLFAQAVTLLSAARQFPNEEENRTLYPLMSKPVSRREYVFAKVLASSLVGWITFVILLLMAVLPIPSLENGSGLLFGQMVLLQLLGIAVVAAIAFLGSLILPHILNLIIVAILVLAGSRVAGLIDSAVVMKPEHAAVNWVTGYLPNFSVFDLVNSYTVGAPALSLVDLAARIVFGLILVIFFLGLSFFLMERREL
jgi:ABC-type transport system involved in multi-copper enzyme maturation permease subunit